jgi:hypothetical protein
MIIPPRLLRQVEHSYCAKEKGKGAKAAAGRCAEIALLKLAVTRFCLSPFAFCLFLLYLLSEWQFV